jgi:hypothetical protein
MSARQSKDADLPGQLETFPRKTLQAQSLLAWHSKRPQAILYLLSNETSDRPPFQRLLDAPRELKEMVCSLVSEGYLAR